MPLQRRAQFRGIHHFNSRLRKHDKIHATDFRLMRTKIFAHHALQPVAKHRRPDTAAGYCKTKARMGEPVWAAEDNQL